MQNKKSKKLSKSEKEQLRKNYVEELIKEVVTDFEARRKVRKPYEKQWELNMNFLAGNQYCDIGRAGEIIDEDKQFYWQKKGVFNHIAPIVESRLSKFSRINPTVFVRPKSDDDKDIERANTAEKFLEGVFKRCDIAEVIKKGTTWSETCGTAFYKIVWNNDAGNSLGVLDGQEVFEGDVEILPISPFEIFPDNLYAEELQDCNSIIHARAVPVSEIKRKYGVDIVGEDVGVFDLANSTSAGLNGSANAVRKDSAIVIEKYEKPTEAFPNGRLITVASNNLLYYGELPYINGLSNSRTFPFVKQESVSVAGSFFGTSIIERMIPVQRAFNAVKNRKHEFLNRISMGIMTVEDGSIDVEDLSEEGLSPGKVLVYRQGSKAPEIMDETSFPSEFTQEEERLINEFVIISGVSDVVSSSANATLSSGSALEILIEQDNERMVFSAESIRKCYLDIAKHSIRLYSQFMAGVRAVKYQDTYGKVRLTYADKSTISSDDVYLDSENELLTTHRQKKEMLFKLYSSGLLNDEQGTIRQATREKMLSLLGYKDLDYKKGLSRLQEEKAQKENDVIRKQGLNIEEIDDDSIHIDEHTRYILCEYESLSKEQKQRLFEHLKQHKLRLANAI